MNKKLLGLVAGACMLPLAAHAELQSITFKLLNDGASVKNPITVTGGYMSYFSTIKTDPRCSDSVNIPLATPIKVGTGKDGTSAAKISLPVTANMNFCIQEIPNNQLWVTLIITSVDGKVKGGDTPYCYVGDFLWTGSQNPEFTLNIRETDDTFHCNQLQFKR